MGARTPESDQRGPDTPSKSDANGAGHSPKANGASGILQDALGGDDDEDDDEKAGLNSGISSNIEKPKKKRKASKKKKKKATGPAGQTSPPRIELAALFPSENYPTGEFVDYAVKDGNIRRTTAEELRYLDRISDMDDQFLKDYRKAAEVHRQVRGWAQTMAKPGTTLTEIALEIEEGVRSLTGHPAIETGDALKAGMGFPTGLCLNNVAAHWTPNEGAKDFTLQQKDVLSVDFGVHVNGRIVDSAFTVAFDPCYDPLLAAVRDATNTGLREAGIDARIAHISQCIQEAMESYEVEINGKTIPVKAMRNLTGHDIRRYKIHGDKQIPFVKSNTTQRMEEGEVLRSKLSARPAVDIYAMTSDSTATGATRVRTRRVYTIRAPRRCSRPSMTTSAPLSLRSATWSASASRISSCL